MKRLVFHSKEENDFPDNWNYIEGFSVLIFIQLTKLLQVEIRNND